MAKLFGIRPGEGSLVGLLVLHSFFLSIPLVLAETVATTLFLVSFGAGALPYVYIGFAVVSTLTGFIYARIERSVSFSRLLIINIATIFVSLLVLRLGLTLPGQRWIVAVLAVWSEVLWVLASLEFGALLGRVFDIRQGKRLFALASSGDILAAIGGGLLVLVIVPYIGTSNLLLVGAASLGIALALLLAVLRRTSPLLDEAEEPADDEPEQGTSLYRSRYILLILIFSALSLLGYYFLDNLFYVALEAQYPDEEQLVTSLGLFYTATGVLTLVSKTFFTGRLLTRYGLLAGLLAVPVMVAFGASLVLTSHLLLAASLIFWPIVITKLMNEVLKDAVDQPVSLILYQPLTPALRVRSQTVVESVVEPVAGGAAGILLLVLINGLGLGSGALITGLLIIVVAWIVAGIMLGGTYQDALMRALRLRRTSTLILDLSDASSRLVVDKALMSKHPAEVLFALDLLEGSGEQISTNQLGTLLEHPAPEVRRSVLERIENQRRHDLAGTIGEMLEREAVPEVREVAVRTLAAMGEDTMHDAIAPYLTHPDPALRRGAMAGLLRSGGISGVLLAGHQFVTLTTSPAADDRVLAAQVLEKVGLRSFYHPLLRLLEDPDGDVRRSALHAAGEVKHPHLWPQVIAALARPGERGAATTALVRGGDSIQSVTEAYFDDPGRRHDIAIRLTRVLRHIPDGWVVTLLASRLDEPATEWRSEILHALADHGYRSPPAQTASVTRRVQSETAYAALLLRVRGDWEQEPACALLIRALNHELQEIRRRIFLWLSFIYDAQVLQQAQLALMYGDRTERSYAVEVIDGLISTGLKPFVLPLLDEPQPEQQLAQLTAGSSPAAGHAVGRLAALIEGRQDMYTSWVRTCACYLAGRIPQSEYRMALAAARGAPDILLQATADWAFSQLETGARSSEPMYSTLERVIILKTIEIFAETPDVVLAEIATIMNEVDLEAGHTIFEKGTLGTSMYVIIEGQVRVHDSGHTLNMLGERAVFGEMAMLDPEPRSASVTAVKDSKLFVIEHAPFYDVLADRVEVARGIIRVLAGYVRARMRDVAALHARVEALEGVVHDHQRGPD